jgi:predicted DNA-binding ribbon-helix-helix protein
VAFCPISINIIYEKLIYLLKFNFNRNKIIIEKRLGRRKIISKKVRSVYLSSRNWDRLDKIANKMGCSTSWLIDDLLSKKIKIKFKSASCA